MTRVDADFLRNVQERCNGGLEWCEKRGIERLDLVVVTAETAKEDAGDAGMASYGIAMFKLGYEVRCAQEGIERFEPGPGNEKDIARGEELAREHGWD